MKPRFNRAGTLLLITLVLPLILIVAGVVSRVSGSADTTIALFFLCTAAVYVSFGAGVLVPVWMAVAFLFGAEVERRRIVLLLLLSAANIAVAVVWLFVFVPQVRFRW